MKRLIRKILREEIEKSDRHYRMLDKISDHVEIPYVQQMKDKYGVTDKESQKYILKQIYGNDINFLDKNNDFGIIHNIRDTVNPNFAGKLLYIEDSTGWWRKFEYDDKGNQIYFEKSTGYWLKENFDDNGNQIYFENSDEEWGRFKYDDKGKMIYEEYSDGYWEKYEYDDKGNIIYYENSTGFWKKREYGDNGDMLYYENSNGRIIDNR